MAGEGLAGVSSTRGCLPAATEQERVEGAMFNLLEGITKKNYVQNKTRKILSELIIYCHTGACSQRPGVHGMSWQQANPGRAMIFRIEDNSKITTVAQSEKRRASKISGNDSRRATTGSRRVRTSSKGTRTARG